jgi:16S rRNA (adenine1518-N6/adenine1519-N6)-dimethyltransferase
MSTGSSQNQTLSFLMRRFAEVGIEPRTQLGQNFLIDLNLLRLLVQTAQLGPDDVVLEVGTGTGSLTAMLAQTAGVVVTVEVDPRLYQLAGEDLLSFANVRMLHTDALKSKSRIAPEVLAAIDEEMAKRPQGRFKLAANLPYHVATPLLSNFLTLDHPPSTMTVTIQKEVGDRIVASPGTRDYGALSVWMQCQCRVNVVRVMPPSVFWPKPKIHSSIVQIEVDETLRGRIPDRAFFHTFVRSIFLHRRKILRSELIAVFKNRLDKSDVDRILAAQGLEGSLRAEQLSPDVLLALSEAVRAELAGEPGEIDN